MKRYYFYLSILLTFMAACSQKKGPGQEYNKSVSGDTLVNVGQANNRKLLTDHSFDKVEFMEGATFDFKTYVNQDTIILSMSECTSSWSENESGKTYHGTELKIEPNGMDSPRVEAISFYDYNHDGAKDVLIIYTYQDASKNVRYYNKIFRSSTGWCYLKEDQYYNTNEAVVARSIGDFKRNIKAFFDIYRDINVGKGEQYESLTAYFADKESPRNNVNIHLKDSLYIFDNAIWISYCYNFNIYGENRTKLFCLDSTDNVMWIQSSINFSLNNLNLKHEKLGADRSFSCTGGVIALESCANVTIENCDLNGCGQVGLIDYGNHESIYVKNSVIHNCSLAAYKDFNQNLFWQPTEETSFRFINTQMYDNGGYDHDEEKEDYVEEYDDEVY